MGEAVGKFYGVTFAANGVPGDARETGPGLRSGPRPKGGSRVGGVKPEQEALKVAESISGDDLRRSVRAVAEEAAFPPIGQAVAIGIASGVPVVDDNSGNEKFLAACG